MLIDTHCHLDFEWFDSDRDAVLERALSAGVQLIVVPAIDIDNCATVLQLADQYDAVYAAVGVHPNSTLGWCDDWLDKLRDFAQHEKVVAIGEIGLDYYRNRSPKPVQHRALIQQLELAYELKLPVIIHNRDSSEDMVRLLSESCLAGTDAPGVLHSFSSDWLTAQAVIDMGFMLGFTGPITYKKADDLREIAARIPMERMLVETDAPFLAPQAYRGKRNEPSYVKLVAERLAEVRAVDFKTISSQTSANAVKLFGNKLR